MCQGKTLAYFFVIRAFSRGIWYDKIMHRLHEFISLILIFWIVFQIGVNSVIAEESEIYSLDVLPFSEMKYSESQNTEWFNQEADRRAILDSLDLSQWADSFNWDSNDAPMHIRFTANEEVRTLLSDMRAFQSISPAWAAPSFPIQPFSQFFLAQTGSVSEIFATWTGEIWSVLQNEEETLDIPLPIKSGNHILIEKKSR